MNSVTKSVGQEGIEALVPILEKHQGFPSKRYPVRSNWASKMGHACERYLYHLRHDWEQAEARDWKGIGILGNLLADHWVRERSNEGFDIIHEQLALSDEMVRKYQIGGRIDCRIGWRDMRPMLAEIKTMNERYYEQINTYEDMADSKAEWIKGYPAQLQLYLLSQNEEAGLFILINKSTLEWKVIPVYLDYSYTEWLLKRAERVNKANETGIPPERIPYGKTCQGCEFKTICLPDIKNDGLDLVDNEELEKKLIEREELKSSTERYIELDDDIKETAKLVGKDFIVNTSFKIEVKKTIGKRVNIKSMPIEIISQFEVPTETVRVNIIPLGKK